MPATAWQAMTLLLVMRTSLRGMPMLRAPMLRAPVQLSVLQMLMMGIILMDVVVLTVVVHVSVSVMVATMGVRVDFGMEGGRETELESQVPLSAGGDAHQAERKHDRHRAEEDRVAHMVSPQWEVAPQAPVPGLRAAGCPSNAGPMQRLPGQRADYRKRFGTICR